MQKSIILKNLPLPPSENHLYPSGSNGRRFKSKAYEAYLQSMIVWKYANSQLYLAAKNQCFSWLKEGLFLDVKALFVFERSKLFTKKNTVKQLDTSNRIKALHDGLSKNILGIDDRYFWSISGEKAVGLRDEVFILIKPTGCKTFSRDGSSMEEHLMIGHLQEVSGSIS